MHVHRGRAPRATSRRPTSWPRRARWRATSGATLGVTSDLDGACKGADVLYTDVWASMGQEAEKADARAAFQRLPGQRARCCALAQPDAIVLHCLPAHYGEEIDYAASRPPELGASSTRPRTGCTRRRR